MHALKPTPTLPLAGAVLVGGRSIRMGRDKARLEVDGVPLWRRQRDVLLRFGAQRVVLVLRPRQRSFGSGPDEIRDRATNSGPLAGLQAAMIATSAEFLAVVAVDMPRIDPAWFERLRRRSRRGLGAVYQTADGFEPLAALYPADALPIVERRLAKGQLALQGLVQELIRKKLLVAVPLPAKDLARAANWNTPTDLLSA